MAKYKNGSVGIWDDEHEVVEAARRTRAAGYTKFEAISPYPVHGMEEAMGIKRSWIPYLTFLFGICGCLGGLLLTYYVAVVDWPINIGGKPFFSLPAFIPILFECTIFCAAHGSVIVLLFIACRLPKVDPPIIDPSLSSHRFAIFIPEDDTGYDRANAQKFLKDLGAKETREAVF